MGQMFQMLPLTPKIRIESLSKLIFQEKTNPKSISNISRLLHFPLEYHLVFIQITLKIIKGPRKAKTKPIPNIIANPQLYVPTLQGIKIYLSHNGHVGQIL